MKKDIKIIDKDTNKTVVGFIEITNEKISNTDYIKAIKTGFVIHVSYMNKLKSEGHNLSDEQMHIDLLNKISDKKELLEIHNKLLGKGKNTLELFDLYYILSVNGDTTLPIDDIQIDESILKNPSVLKMDSIPDTVEELFSNDTKDDK